MKEEASRLRRQARAYRRVADHHHDAKVIKDYAELARQYDELAAAVEQALGHIEAGKLLH